MFLKFLLFFLGTVIVFLIGLFETLLLKVKLEKTDKILLSFGLGNVTVVMILFVMNQYLGILLTGENILISVFLTSLLLILACFYRRINLPKELKSLFELSGNLWDEFKKTEINRIFITFLIIFYLLCFYKAIFFPVVHWDSVYSFAYWPKVIWQEQTIPLMSSSYHEFGMAWGNQNFPVLLNNYYFALYGNFDEFFIRILIPLWSIFNLLIIYRFSYLLFKNKSISALCSVLFLSTNVFTTYSVFILSPMYVLFFPLLAIYFYVLYEKNREKSFLIISSVLFGITLAIKYVWIIPFFLFVLSIIIVKKEIKKPITISLIAIAVSLFFYMRNIIYYHNPLFPLFFGGKNYNHFLSQLFWKNWMIPDFTNIALFLDIIFKTGVLIWVFFFLFGVFLLRNSSRVEKVLYLSILLYIPVYIITSAFLPTTSAQRHILPQLGMMSIFAGMYFWDRTSKKISFKFAFIPLVTSIVMLILGMNIYIMRADLLLLITIPPMMITPVLALYRYEVITSNKLLALVIIFLMVTPIGYVSFMKRVSIWELPSEEEVIKKYWDDIYVTGQYINQNLPLDAKILSFENRRYYFERNIVPADQPDMIFDYQNRTISEVLKELQKREIHYLLANPLWKDKGFWEHSTLHTNIDYLQQEGSFKKLFEYKNITLFEIIY